MSRADGVFQSGSFFFTVSIVLACFPKVGLFVAKSRWTPIFWIVALAIGGLGQWLWNTGNLAMHSSTEFYWAPLYQIFIYSLALRLFFWGMNRPPRDITYNLNAGLLWDRVFFFVVIIISIVPIAHLIAPR